MEWPLAGPVAACGLCGRLSANTKKALEKPEKS